MTDKLAIYTVTSDERFLSGGVTIKGPDEIVSGTRLVELSAYEDKERQRALASQLRVEAHQAFVEVLDELKEVKAERDHLKAHVFKGVGRFIL